MPTARSKPKLVWFEERLWAIGGSNSSPLQNVESYDPISNSWKTESGLNLQRGSNFAWSWQMVNFSQVGVMESRSLP